MCGGLRATYDIKSFLHCRIFDPVLYVLVDLWSSTRLISYKFFIFPFPFQLKTKQTYITRSFQCYVILLYNENFRFLVSLPSLSHQQFTLVKMVAFVQRPAPSFKATAVVGGLFEDIDLSTYLGQWYVYLIDVAVETDARSLFRVVLLFYPM